jgi:hypothetical protein
MTELDPKQQLLKKIKEIAQQSRRAQQPGQHAVQVRIMPKHRPSSDHGSCSCCCS